MKQILLWSWNQNSGCVFVHSAVTVMHVEDDEEQKTD